MSNVGGQATLRKSAWENENINIDNAELDLRESHNVANRFRRSIHWENMSVCWINGLTKHFFPVNPSEADKRMIWQKKIVFKFIRDGWSRYSAK